MVEHIPFKDGVLGSNPKRITRFRDGSDRLFLFTCRICERVRRPLFVNKSVILNCLNVELTDFYYVDNKDRHIVSART